MQENDSVVWQQEIATAHLQIEFLQDIRSCKSFPCSSSIHVKNLMHTHHQVHIKMAEILRDRKKSNNSYRRHHIKIKKESIIIGTTMNNCIYMIDLSY
jgi:hypothetical protein